MLLPYWDIGSLTPLNRSEKRLEATKKMPEENKTGVVAEAAAQQEAEVIVVDEAGEQPAATQEEAEKPKPETKEERLFRESEVQQIVQERIKKMKAEVDEAKSDRELVKELVEEGYGSPSEIRAQIRASREEKARKAATEAGIQDPAALDKFIQKQLAEHPAIKQAQRYTETLKIQEEVAGLLSYLKTKGFPDATDDEVKQAYEKKSSEGLSLKGAYLDLYGDKLEGALRKKAQERQADSDKHGTESSGDAPIPDKRERITLSTPENEWAKDAVRRGTFKTVAEAARALKETKDARKLRGGK